MDKIVRKMKSILSGVMLVAMLIVVTYGSLARAQYEWDEHTVLLEHFDGTTTGETFGSVSYVPSTIIPGVPGAYRSVDLEQGDWVRYTLPGWYQWSTNYDPSGKEGTCETWVYPREYGISLGNWEWYSTSSYPPAGHIGGLYLNEDGKLGWAAWTAISGPPLEYPIGNTTIPLNQWTHVLATWHESGTELYVNGVLDGFSPDNCYPALNPTFYIYLNSWGQKDLGYIDEFRILKTYTIPEPATILLLGFGGLALLRRKRSYGA
jgi:hypothetical protein